MSTALEAKASSYAQFLAMFAAEGEAGRAKAMAHAELTEADLPEVEAIIERETMTPAERGAAAIAQAVKNAVAEAMGTNDTEGQGTASTEGEGAA